MPPVHRCVRLRLASITQVEGMISAQPQPAYRASRVGRGNQCAILFRHAIDVGAPVDDLRLGFQDPIPRQPDRVAGLRRYRPGLGVIVDPRKHVAFHAVLEPTVLRPGVHIGAKPGFVVLKPCGIQTRGITLHSAPGLVGVAVGAGPAVGAAVAQHDAQVQPVGFGCQPPLRDIATALQQKQVRVDVEVGILAAACLPRASGA
ncbi:hypothetical protein D3C72_1764140 [compost metagenome]